MTTVYWVSEGGLVAFRVDGDPMSDGFFYPSRGLQAWLEEKREMGAKVTYISPPREEIWGGPHFGFTMRVRVVAMVEVGSLE